ncbi:MAG: RNA-binding domain-containing protein [Ruminococcus sp.]|jgi:ATP-dependent DNA helicase RecG
MIDFNHLRKYRENNRIEAKRATGGLPESIWETYSAFANTMGGVILLGVVEKKDKSFEAVDLSDPDSLAGEFWSLVNNPAKASVNILTKHDIAVHRVEEKRILSITVPRAERRDRPVYVNGDPYTGTYRRDGEGDYHCSREAVKAMMADALEESCDSCLLTYADMTALDEKSVREYRKMMHALRPGHVWESLEDEEFLCRIEGAGHDREGICHPTAAGLLMFGKEENILVEFPEFSLRFQGSPDWGHNLFQFYKRVWPRIMNLLQLKRERAKEEMTLERAIKDALANCLVNGDYQSEGGIEIAVGTEEITFANPGSFRMDIEKARKGGESDPRNAGLNRMFQLIQVSEGLGSGLARIYSVWNRHGLSAPVIEERFCPERIILHLSLKKHSLLPLNNRKNASIRSVFDAKQLQKQTVIDYVTRNVAVTEKQLSMLPELESCSLPELLKEMCREDILTSQVRGNKTMYSLKA